MELPKLLLLPERQKLARYSTKKNASYINLFTFVVRPQVKMLKEVKMPTLGFFYHLNIFVPFIANGVITRHFRNVVTYTNALELCHAV